MQPVDVRQLLRQPGSSRRVALVEPIAGLSTELASVPDDAPIRAELLLESVVEGIWVTGRVSGPMRVSCARCLTPIEEGFRVEVGELYAPDATPDDDAYPLGDEVLDPEPMIRDAVLLAIPFSPLCRPDCLGLCERCGGDRNRGECSCPPATDPRWAVLQDLELD
jgi:uncharacterized protein